MRRLAAILVLAVAVTGLAAPAAGAARKKRKPPPVLKSMWGPATLPNGSSAFPLYKSLGVDVLQMQVGWARIALTPPAQARNPNDPAYVWPEALDEFVRGARRAGIKVALMVKETPPWANGAGPRTQAPANPRDYADFLVALARRYPRVHHWMIWGEPSRTANWTPLPVYKPDAPRAYAKLLDRAYGSLKKHDRRNIVIGGMTFTIGEVMPRDWVRWMRLPNGKPPRLDWYGHNAFGNRIPDLAQRPYYSGLRDFSDLDTLHREVKRAYRGRRIPPFWISEFAVSSDRTNRAFNFFVSREDQARWLTAAYRIANRVSWIAGVGWYKLLDEPVRNGVTTGLLDVDGNPKPAFYAYQRVR